LPAETLLDAVCQVTGQPEAFPEMPSGTRAAALQDTSIPSAFMDLFGRPARQVTCECERGTETSVAQALHLINAETLNTKITAKGGLLDRLLAGSLLDAEVLDSLYLTCLGRKPIEAERRIATEALAKALA